MDEKYFLSRIDFDELTREDAPILERVRKPVFAIEQQVVPRPGTTLDHLFSGEVGTVLERRYNLENGRWVYLVQFAFGAYPHFEYELQALK